MNQSDLISNLHASNPGLTRSELRRSIQMIHRTMIESLSRQDRVEIRGFGSFFLSLRPSHRFHNPRTGKQVIIPPRRIPRFKAGKNLRKTVDSGASGKTR